jgi:hypothetical protein
VVATTAASRPSTTLSRELPTITVQRPVPQVAPRPTVALPPPTPSADARLHPLFAVVGGLGLLATAGLLATQWRLTRPGRKGPTL